MTTKKTKKTAFAFYEASKIDAAIVVLARDAGRLQDRIHRLAVSVLKVWHDAPAKARPDAAAQAAERLTAIQAASPYHANAFAKWVAEFTPLQWSKENKTWYRHEADSTIMGKAFMAARDTTFWTFSPAPEPKPFDLMEILTHLVDRAEKRRVSKTAHMDEDNIPDDVMAGLKKLVNAA